MRHKNNKRNNINLKDILLGIKKSITVNFFFSHVSRTEHSTFQEKI